MADYLTALGDLLASEIDEGTSQRHIGRSVRIAAASRAARRSRTLRLWILAPALAVLISTSGVAVAGSLPYRVQGMVADAARFLPVPVPIPYPAPTTRVITESTSSTELTQPDAGIEPETLPATSQRPATEIPEDIDRPETSKLTEAGHETSIGEDRETEEAADWAERGHRDRDERESADGARDSHHEGDRDSDRDHHAAWDRDQDDRRDDDDRDHDHREHDSRGEDGRDRDRDGRGDDRDRDRDEDHQQQHTDQDRG